MSCRCCDSTVGVQTRSFVWNYRPRAKDIARGHVAKQTTLAVEVCADCFKYTSGIQLTGWDMWEAVDGLCVIIERAKGALLYEESSSDPESESESESE